ncbi:MAG TPA: alpha/beta hydrolase [Gemmatimonadaceae bacterium]|jgi:pimeloyl-ACP methyl ester carboxylesterase
MPRSRLFFLPLFFASAFGCSDAQAGLRSAAPANDKSQSAAKPTIVLVHGAFANASGWDAVIRILQTKGYEVSAVENPLSSYEADIETTKRLIDAQKGATVVVAHSYGGAVMTAAASSPNVKALVYLAAFGNDMGEPLGPLLDKYPSKALTAFVPDAAGFLTIDRAKFHDIFAQDLPLPETNVMAVTQKPLSNSVFKATATFAAWRNVPSWFVVAQHDNVINPDLERFFAKRMGAKTTEINSSHVVFMSHPREVADVIESAARAATTTAVSKKQ